MFEVPLQAVRRDLKMTERMLDSQAPSLLTMRDHIEVRGKHHTGPPRSHETAPPPRAAIGPWAFSYCRVLGGHCF